MYLSITGQILFSLIALWVFGPIAWFSLKGEISPFYLLGSLSLWIVVKGLIIQYSKPKQIQ